MYERNWQDLCNAIIIAACKDYREAVRLLRNKPADLSLLTEKEQKKYKKAERTVKQVSKFMKSKYFTSLTELDGEALLAKLDEELAEI